MKKHRTVEREQQAHRARQKAFAALRRQSMSHPDFPVAVSADELFGAVLPREKEVECPVLGRKLLVRELTVQQQAALNQQSLKFNKDNVMGIEFEKQAVLQIMLAVINPETGKPLFSPADTWRLKQMPAGAFDPVVKQLREWSGTQEGDGATANSVDDLFRE